MHLEIASVILLVVANLRPSFPVPIMVACTQAIYFAIGSVYVNPYDVTRHTYWAIARVNADMTAVPALLQ